MQKPNPKSDRRNRWAARIGSTCVADCTQPFGLAPLAV